MEKIKITDKVIAEHGLTPDYYQKILDILKREPTIVELGMYSVLWSEHCSYRHSRPVLSLFPTKAKHVLQGPGENSGVVDIGDGLGIAMKIESHNHPSALEPFQGAATGVGGILRDVFTMGARPIASLNSLRFGPLDNPKNRYLFSGVVEGISSYGNCFGVPTVAGEVYFEDCYTGNCLVNAMAVGVVKTGSSNGDGKVDEAHLHDEPYGHIIKGLASGVGNPVIYVGSSTGRDGIHGATFASVELSQESEEKRSSVQVGDPFTEKLLLEACLELIKTGYVVGMQDMGAAGLTSSSSEMASRAGTGIEMDVSLIPQREENMTPYDIMLSESQERMLVVVKKGKEQAVNNIFKKWGLNSVVIGKVTDDKMLTVKVKNEIVAQVPARSLADDAPVVHQKTKEPAYFKANKDEWKNLLNDKDAKINDWKNLDYNNSLLKLLASPNIANKRWVYEQYDHMVQINTAVLPGKADAAVLRLKGTNKAISVTTDGNSKFCNFDPFIGGQIAVAEAARNVACTGALPYAVTNCLNFGNPEKQEIFWQFRKTIEGMSKACEVLETPVISGNVSFYNEDGNNAIYPTPVIGMLGLIRPTEGKNPNYITMGFKNEGDIVVLVGENKDELGCSEFLKVIHDKDIGTPPDICLIIEKSVHHICIDSIQSGIIQSAHDCAEGGLAVALAECAIDGNIGANINLKKTDIRWDSLMFGETQSRVILTVKPENFLKLEEIIHQYNIHFEVIGKVGSNKLNITVDDKKVLDSPVNQLKEAYLNSIPEIMKR